MLPQLEAATLNLLRVAATEGDTGLEAGVRLHEEAAPSLMTVESIVDPGRISWGPKEAPSLNTSPLMLGALRLRMRLPRRGLIGKDWLRT